MKTIHKHTGTGKQKAHGHLVDHPLADEMLTTSKMANTWQHMQDFIRMKREKATTNHALNVLFFNVGLCLSLALTIAVFEWETVSNEITVDLSGSSSRFEEFIDIPATQQIQKPPSVILAPAIVEVSNEEIIENIEINLDIEMSEDTRIEEFIYQSQQTNEVIVEEKADEIFTIVEEQPSPKGGMKEFYDFVFVNLKYPTKASRMGIEGRVFVEFIVEKDGSLTDIKVAKGIGGGCDEEAIRVISEAPKWNPGKQRGQPVRVRMVMPIVFKLLT